MKLVLTRKWFTDRSTIGELFVDGSFECYTLEDVVRSDPKPETPANEAKVPGRTAIQAGGFDVTITFSNRFGKLMPLLMNVPGFSGVRIHCGNTDKDTEGCILVGLTRGTNLIGKSKDAYERLFSKLERAHSAGDPIFLAIRDERPIEGEPF